MTEEKSYKDRLRDQANQTWLKEKPKTESPKLAEKKPDSPTDRLELDEVVKLQKRAGRDEYADRLYRGSRKHHLGDEQ